MKSKRLKHVTQLLVKNTRKAALMQSKQSHIPIRDLTRVK